MGWINDSAPDHEGYLIGIVPLRRPDDWRFRELTMDDEPTASTIPLRHVQVGCDCGWRSPRLDAPLGTSWWPSIVDAPDWFEERARLLWREHIDLEALRGRGQTLPEAGAAATPRAIHDLTMYPSTWPACQCGAPVLDGHLTCGRLECDERIARLSDGIRRHLEAAARPGGVVAMAVDAARARDAARTGGE